MQRIHILLALIVIFLLYACNSSPKKSGCKQYHTGTFQYHVKNKQGNYNFVIERNETTQTETNEQTKASTTASVKWTGDCTYELRYMEGSNQLSPAAAKLKKSMVLKTEILKGTNEYYLFKTRSNMGGEVLKDTMWVE